MKKRNSKASFADRQQGAILVISLIILLILTIVSLSSTQGILLQEKMTGAQRENTLALQAAEAGLQDAIADAVGYTNTNDFTDAGDAANNEGLYTDGNAPVDLTAASAWLATNSQTATPNTSGGSEVDPDNSGKLPPAKYFIEYVGEITVKEDAASSGGPSEAGVKDNDNPTVQGFRVVVRSQSRDGVSVRFLEGLVGNDNF